MADVWLAEDLRLERPVALKVLRESASDTHTGDLVTSLDREARVIARLQHPNIVGIYDTGVFEGRHYLVMEYVQGYTLRQLLDARGPVQEGDAVRYALPVAGALQYAHDHGVVHCDVKPENILISEQGVPKVTDFGVAETVARTLSPEQARDIVGTIAYLAPEVLQGANADPRSDVYSLAMTVYEMVAGRLPFSGATPAAAAGQRLAVPAPPLRTFNPAASPDLEVVLAKALSIVPAARFASAFEFAAAMRRASLRPGAATPVARPAPAVASPPIIARVPDQRQARRNPTERLSRGPVQQRPPGGGGVSAAGVAAILGIIVVAALGGLVAALVLTRSDTNSGTASPTATSAPTAVATATLPPPTATPTNEPTLTPTPTVTPTPSPTPTVRATATPEHRSPTPRPSGSPQPGFTPPSPNP